MEGEALRYQLNPVVESIVPRQTLLPLQLSSNERQWEAKGSQQPIGCELSERYGVSQAKTTYRHPFWQGACVLPRKGDDPGVLDVYVI